MTARYFEVPFAESGDKVAVPDAVQPDGSVSYTQGYGIDYSTPVGSGGKNIERSSFNELLYDVTLALQQFQTNGSPLWYAALAGAAGYPQYAVVTYAIDGKTYQSQVNANASTPGTNADWAELPLGNFSGFDTGDVKFTINTAAGAGWVMCNDGTIGNAASGGTTRANADTQALFAVLWNNVSNTYAPVSGGRGGSAAADFAANKTIGLTKMMGRALAVAGSGSGLSARSLGQTLGEETHVLTTPEMPSHSHTATVTDLGHLHTASGNVNSTPTTGSGETTAQTGQTPGAWSTNSATTGITVSNSSTGGGGAHNNMQPTSFLNAMIKL